MRLNRFERWMLGGSTLVVALTGTVYAWMKYGMTTDDPYAVVNHPWQPAVLKLHIVTAPLLVFAVGLVFSQHIYRRWRSGRPAGRHTGSMLLFIGAPMVLSGYLIQAFTGPVLLGWMVGIHLVTGTAWILGYSSHRARMKARRVEAHERLRTVDGADESDREECA